VSVQEGQFQMFQDVQSLNSKIAIYVPSTQNVNETASRELVQKWVLATHQFLASRFGGATSLAGLGSWNSQSGELVIEDVTIVYSFAEKFTASDERAILQFTRELKAGLGQEAILIELDGGGLLL
jgi:hypothetical protein